MVDKKTMILDIIKLKAENVKLKEKQKELYLALIEIHNKFRLKEYEFMGIESLKIIRGMIKTILEDYALDQEDE